MVVRNRVGVGLLSANIIQLLRVVEVEVKDVEKKRTLLVLLNVPQRYSSSTSSPALENADAGDARPRSRPDSPAWTGTPFWVARAYGLGLPAHKGGQ